MAKPYLCLTRRLPEPVMAVLDDRFVLTMTPGSSPLTRDALLNGVRRAAAMICTLAEPVDADLLRNAPHLRVVANYAVGYNNIDLESAKARGIVVTNTPNTLTDTTADLTWALLLATARRVAEGHALVQGGQWEGWEPNQLLGADVHGKTLGIIGMGRIGHAVARRAAGFNMTILYCRRTSTAADNPQWRAVPFEDLLTNSDFISLHVPLTADTHHLIDREEFGRMRPTAFLINTSRGPVVNEAALVEALREGRLAGAGLDVYEQEPALHPGLHGLVQVVTLPHLGSATLATRIRMGMMCVDNVVAVLEGRAAPNRVG